MQNLEELLEKINIKGTILFDEPMSRHTSFKIGGPADALIVPQDMKSLTAIYRLLRQRGVPCFILGGGANILVSDNGIRGAVIDLSRISGCRRDRRQEDGLAAYAGTPVTEVCNRALRLNLSGIEFLYTMPGSIGGSIWMNARCYGSSIAEVLSWVDILNDEGKLERMEIKSEDFHYKHSPFQEKKAVICRAGFRLQPGTKKQMRRKMEQYRQDREQKGHFRYPGAGSIFKNNRDFGNPTGKIIDSLGLKGYTVGQAKISDHHANIIINTGTAMAGEVSEIIRFVEKTVRRRLGLELEREILLVGDW